MQFSTTTAIACEVLGTCTCTRTYLNKFFRKLFRKYIHLNNWTFNYEHSVNRQCGKKKCSIVYLCIMEVNSWCGGLTFEPGVSSLTTATPSLISHRTWLYAAFICNVVTVQDKSEPSKIVYCTCNYIPCDHADEAESKRLPVYANENGNVFEIMYYYSNYSN